MSKISTKLSEEFFNDFNSHLEEKLNELDFNLTAKADRQEIPDPGVVSTLIEEQTKGFVDSEELEVALKNQNSINEALCSENCTARWLWKSGKLKKGYQIPWEAQSINTCPENFLQHIGDPLIVTATPGLYEMKFGFYSDAQPSIQVIVNGEVVISAVNSSSYSIKHSQQGVKETIKYQMSGNMTGMTLVDFICLPANAQIYLTYSGEEQCEGFVSFKKL